jgi:chromosome segregation ATPase
MTIAAEVKKYQQRLKDSDATLSDLAARAREIAAMEDTLHDAETAYEDAHAELESVAWDKQTVKEQLSETMLTGDGDVDGLRGEYTLLSEREVTARAQLAAATATLEENIPDRTEIAGVRAQLHNLRGGGVELVTAVRDVIEVDAGDLRARVVEALEVLPPGDDLDTLYALGYTDLADGWRESIERNEAIRPGGGDQARDALGREVARALARV